MVEAILESRKPLVGFQTMGDVMYMLGGIYKELPRTLLEFLDMMKEVELLVDLKEVVEMEGLVEEDIRHCNLTHAFQQVKKERKVNGRRNRGIMESRKYEERWRAASLRRMMRVGERIEGER